MSLTYVQITCHKGVSKLSPMCHLGATEVYQVAPPRCSRHWCALPPNCALCVPTSSADRPCATRTPLSSSFSSSSSFSFFPSFYASFFLLLPLSFFLSICHLNLVNLYFRLFFPYLFLPFPHHLSVSGLEKVVDGAEGGGRRDQSHQTHPQGADSLNPCSALPTHNHHQCLHCHDGTCIAYAWLSAIFGHLRSTQSHFIDLLCLNQCWNCRFNMFQPDADF